MIMCAAITLPGPGPGFAAMAMGLASGFAAMARQ
jgi:hypothetical protein